MRSRSAPHVPPLGFRVNTLPGRGRTGQDGAGPGRAGTHNPLAALRHAAAPPSPASLYGAALPPPPPFTGRRQRACAAATPRPPLG